MRHSLSKPYPSRYGLPVIDALDPRIFELRYYGECMNCNFCQDSCCQYGVDIEVPRMNAIMDRADELERYLGNSRDDWFRTEPDDVGIVADDDYPGGEYTRTAVVELPSGRSKHNELACVFLDPIDRGCRIHRFALERGIDVHEIKPIICLLFPICFVERALVPAIEFDHNELICAGEGPTIYEMARNDLEYYFGSEFVCELDLLAASSSSQPGSLTLPMVA